MSLRAAIAWWRRTLSGRTLSCYGQARGGLLAGGMAFAGFFSLFPALALAFAVFGLVLGPRTDLQRQVAERIDAVLGVRLIGTAPGDGLVSIGDLVQGRVLTTAGLLGTGALVIGGLGWLEAARQGIRAVAGLPLLRLSVRNRAGDVGAAATLGAAALVSAVAGVAVGAAAGVVLGWLGLGSAQLAGRVVTVATGVVLALLDAVILVVLVRLLGRVRLHGADLWPAALAGGVALEALTLSSGLLLHRVSRNPLLAASSVPAVLLVWMGLAARVTLLAAALGVTLARQRGRDAEDGAARDHGGPEAGDPEAGRPENGWPEAGWPEAGWPENGRPENGRPENGARRAAGTTGGKATMMQDGRRPQPGAGMPARDTVGIRAQDRVTLAAGMVLGAGLLVVVRVLANAMRTVRAALRASHPPR